MILVQFNFHGLEEAQIDFSSIAHFVLEQPDKLIALYMTLALFLDLV